MRLDRRPGFAAHQISIELPLAAVVLLLARLLFAFSVLAAPWLFGGTETYLLRWLIWPLALSGVAFTIASVMRGQVGAVRLPVLLVPVLLGAGWGLLQTAPIYGPSGIASSAATLRIELDGSGAKTAPLSVDPASTRRESAWLVLAAIVVLLGANLFQDIDSRRALFAALSANGAAVSALALAQLATETRHIYWVLPRLSGGALPVGPFAYHNQAGSYFAVAGAALIGWLLLPIDIQHQRRRAFDNGIVALQTAVGLLLAAGLIASFSRGSLLASLGASAAAAFVARRHLRIQQAAIGVAVVVLAAAAVLLWANSLNLASKRLASLGDEQTFQEDGRFEVWEIAARAAREHGVLGAGLGSYRRLHPMHKRLESLQRIDRAHNQYLETIVDGGVIAALLLIAAIVIAASDAGRAAVSSNPINKSAGVAAIAALAFQVLHGIVDFCLYLPANLLLYATIAGLASGGLKAAPANRVGFLRGGVVATLAVAGLAAAVVVDRHTRVDAAIQALPWGEEDNVQKVADAETWVTDLRRVARTCPDDGQAWQALGEALVLRYRLQARDALAEEFGADPTNPQVWRLTKPSQLLNVASTARRQGDLAKIAELQQQEVVAANLPMAIEAFDQALSACPLLPGATLRLLELGWLRETETRNDAQQSIDRIVRVSPANARRLFEAGALAYLGGTVSDAWPAWRRCLELDTGYGGQVVTLAALHLTTDELLQELLPADAAAIWAIHQKLPDGSTALEFRQAMLQRARADLRGLETPSGGRGRTPKQDRLLGQLCAALGDSAGAVAAYQDAVRWRPTEARWRYELALQLQETGQLDAAIREAVACARIAPTVKRYERLLATLRKQQAAR